MTEQRASDLSAGAEPLSPGLQRYLYFTAAVTGAAIMIVEILGAKMLAPYIGTSHFVWTAQIAVALVALASGYYVGGRLVDRSPRLEPLYWSILGAGVYLAGTVLVVEPLAYACLEFELALGSLLASTLLFFVPLGLLAMVGPFVVRVLTRTVSGVGGHVGRLTAISTLGSFFGTLLIGYVLVPFFSNSSTMYLTAGLLMGVAAGYLLGWGRKRSSATLVTVATLFSLMLGGLRIALDQPGRGAAWREIHRVNSNFGNIQIFEDQRTGHRYYLNDYLIQNGFDPHTGQSTFSFTYLLYALTRGYHQHIDDVLAIGLGVGIVPMQFAREGTRVEVVEINPTIVPVAAGFFDFDSTQLELNIADGREFINRTSKTYDAVILDAFLGDSVPTHLMSRESFVRMRALLRPGGLLMINSFGGEAPEHSILTASLELTLGVVFRSVKLHHSSSGNVVIAASDQVPLELAGSIDPATVHESCREQVLAAWTNQIRTDPTQGIVLTDDFNPVEYFDASSREQTRKSLALLVRKH